MIRLEKRVAPSKLWLFLSPNLAVVLSLLGGAVLFTLLGFDPVESLRAYFISPIRDFYGLTELVIKSTPLILIGLGLSFSYTANVWNIGAEGQYIAGGLAVTAVALWFYESSSFLALPTMFLAGVAGGMLWAVLPAFLKAKANVNEILTSLMLNYVALQLLIYMTNGPLRDPDGMNFPESKLFSAESLLPILADGTRLSLAVFVALVFVLLAWISSAHTLFGFQAKIFGLAPAAARYAGFSEGRMIFSAFMVSGGMAGVAAFTELAGPVGQITVHFSTNYGYTAIIVAFLGRLHPLGVLLGGLVIGLSFLGGESAQIDIGVPLAATGVFQGMLLFFLLACDLLRTYRVRILIGVR